jgi:AraC family L-rhamnose operon regulatory protein RhaS
MRKANTIQTISHKKNPDFRIPITIAGSCDKVSNLSSPCWKMILVEKGVSTIHVNKKRLLVAAPVLLFGSESDSVIIQRDLSWKAVFFLPAVINNALTFTDIRKRNIEQLDLALTLDLFWIEPFLNHERGIKKTLQLSPAAAKAVSEWFCKLDHELNEQESDYWPCRSRSYLIELLLFIGRLYHSQIIPSTAATVVDLPEGLDNPVLIHLHSHYQEKIILDDLARLFNTNRTDLQKQYVRLTGKTIGDYLRELRLSIAKALLAETKLSVGEIAGKVGYSDTTYFIRVFRKTYHMTPAVFRKSIIKSFY